ncbi:hypothetical protein ACFXPS_43330 [Nocardia sp. NPDC059091]
MVAPNMVMAMQDVPVSESGSAAAVQQTGQRIGSTIGAVLVPRNY